MRTRVSTRVLTPGGQSGRDRGAARGLALVVAAGLAVALVVTVAPVVMAVAILVLLVSPSNEAGAACVGTPGGTVGSIAGQPSSGSPGTGTLRSAADLTDTQAAHADAVVAVGRQLGIPDFGIVVALATVAQESTFLNYANDGRGSDLAPDQRGVVRSLQLAHDAVGTDHGSVGIFQQQYPWWGTLEQLMDPATSSRLFYERLVEIPGWQQLTVADAAQRVQRSAYPLAYAKWEPLARSILASSTASGGDVAVAAFAADLCGPGGAMTCPATGLAVEEGLTPDALRVLRCVEQTFAASYGPFEYGGVGDRPSNPNSDHPSGRAVDVMIPEYRTTSGNALGWEIARWLQANAAQLGVKNVIFDEEIWTAGDPVADGGEVMWRPYTHRSGRTDDTHAHRDHVHVSVHGNAAGGVSAGGWQSPIAVAGYQITSPYGDRTHPVTGRPDFHNGVDLAGVPIGTPVVAAASGVVTSAGARGTYGNLVILDHGNGWSTYYAHLQRIDVAVGQAVAGGQPIGTLGNTGRGTGAHLQFEVRQSGVSTNPVTFLASRGVAL